MNAQPKKCDACEAVRRFHTDLVSGLSELAAAMEPGVGGDETDPWPALRGKIAGMTTQQVATVVVWLEEDPRSPSRMDEAGGHVVAWFKDIMTALYTELDLRAAARRAEAP